MDPEGNGLRRRLGQGVFHSPNSKSVIDFPSESPLSHLPSLSIEDSFTALQAASAHQRPDRVLQKQRQQPGFPKPSENQSGPSTLVKAAVWGLSATLGAAALAVTQTALGWGPEVLWKIF